jgi:hypothetical protein
MSNDAASLAQATDEPMAAQAKSGRYLYAVVNAAQAGLCDGLVGVGEGRVYAISEGQVAAVVSDVPNKRIRPERRNLAAHQAVIKGLMDEVTPLPASFGHIAEGPEAIRGILHQNQDVFTEQLRRVEGKVEMGIKVIWDVPNIFEYFMHINNRLRALRDRLFRGGREPSQPDKIELGRAFDRALNEERARHTATVTDALGPLCAEIKANEPHEEREVMNLACLIRRDAQAGFEASVFEAARLFDNSYSFDYSGPWPPYNFVDGEFQFQE